MATDNISLMESYGYLSTPISNDSSYKTRRAYLYESDKCKSFFVCLMGKGFFHLNVPEQTYNVSSAKPWEYGWYPDKDGFFPGGFQIIVRDSKGNKLNTMDERKGTSKFSIVINGEKVLYYNSDAINANLSDYSIVANDDEVISSLETQKAFAIPKSEYDTALHGGVGRSTGGGSSGATPPNENYKVTDTHYSNFKPFSEMTKNNYYVGRTCTLDYVNNPGNIQNGDVYSLIGVDENNPIEENDIFGYTGKSNKGDLGSKHTLYDKTKNTKQGLFITDISSANVSKLANNVYEMKVHIPVTVLSPKLPTFGDITSRQASGKLFPKCKEIKLGEKQDKDFIASINKVRVIGMVEVQSVVENTEALPKVTDNQVGDTHATLSVATGTSTGASKYEKQPTWRITYTRTSTYNDTLPCTDRRFFSFDKTIDFDNQVKIDLGDTYGSQIVISKQTIDEDIKVISSIYQDGTETTGFTKEGLEKIRLGYSYSSRGSVIDSFVTREINIKRTVSYKINYLNVYPIIENH